MSLDLYSMMKKLELHTEQMINHKAVSRSTSKITKGSEEDEDDDDDSIDWDPDSEDETSSSDGEGGIDSLRFVKRCSSFSTTADIHYSNSQLKFYHISGFIVLGSLYIFCIGECGSFI